MSYTLDDMFNKISAYERIQKDFGFVPAGTGVRSWSHKFINEAGEVLNVRGSDWVLYHPEDDVIAEGTVPAELKKFLLSRLSHEDLLEFAARG
jgi:hypothetical protein